MARPRPGTPASDPDDDDEAGAPPIPAGAKNYMTPAGNARLHAELRHLLRVERPKMVDVVSWAAGNGDRSENGDYLSWNLPHNHTLYVNTKP